MCLVWCVSEPKKNLISVRRPGFEKKVSPPYSLGLILKNTAELIFFISTQLNSMQPVTVSFISSGVVMVSNSSKLTCANLASGRGLIVWRWNKTYFFQKIIKINCHLKELLRICNIGLPGGWKDVPATFLHRQWFPVPFWALRLFISRDATDCLSSGGSAAPWEDWLVGFNV